VKENVLVFILLMLTMLYFFPVVFVWGDSMYPTYSHGDFLIAKRCIRRCHTVGKVYVVQVTETKCVIKRLRGILNGRYSFAGDNRKVSTNYNDVDPSCVLAEVKFTLYHQKG